MLGSILGDIIGSIYEFDNTHSTRFPWHQPGMRYTDDSVLTIATMQALLDQTIGYTQAYRTQALSHPRRGYGGRFNQWIHSDSDLPYNSYGNGSGMRVAPVAWVHDTLEEVLEEAKKSAEVTHNHPEGIKGAQAIACATFMARKGSSKADIKSEITQRFDYDLDRTLEEASTYHFTEVCQTTCPEAIIAFMEGNDLEDTIRKAISLGGDSDTIACMAGGIAEAFYGPVSQTDYDFIMHKLDPSQQALIKAFYETYKIPMIKETQDPN